MNNRYKIIVGLLILLSFNWACTDEFLEKDPSDALPKDEVFQSVDNVVSALVGTYDQLSTYTFDGLYTPIMSDVMGEDMMINSVNNYGWFVAAHQLELLPSYHWIQDPWYSGYKIIYDANLIILNTKTVPNISDEDVDWIVGEAKVIRAYVMLKMAQLYSPAYSQNSDAPSIMNVNVETGKDSEDYPRASLLEVYKQIESDLLAAIDALPMDENEDDTYSKDRRFFSGRAAHAIIARMYLDMEEWEKARDYAVLAHDLMYLMTANDWYSGFMTRNSETIFSIGFTQEDNFTYLTIPSFYWPWAGYSSIRANDNFVDLFGAGDIRGNAPLIDVESSYPAEIPGGSDKFVVLKFGHNYQVGNAERISIRASEMVLIEAECEARLSNYTEAREALHRIQNRANAVTRTNTGDALISEILLERRKELYGEGFRLNDIKRTNQPLVREGDHWTNIDFQPGDENYYKLTWPIPQYEIDANTMINAEDQNPGY